jgi:hypothetical protein
MADVMIDQTELAGLRKDSERWQNLRSHMLRHQNSRGHTTLHVYATPETEEQAVNVFAGRLDLLEAWRKTEKR